MNKMTKDILLYFALLLWFVVPAEAQLTIIASDHEASKGDAIEMDVDIVGFDSILTMQFSINWDSSILKFKSAISTDSLSGLSSSPSVSSFNNSKPGELRVLWTSPSGDGVSLPNNSTIFRLNFDVIGSFSKDSTIQVSFSNTPIAIDISAEVNGTSTDIGLAPQSGSILIEGMISPTYSLAANNAILYQNEPNPFKEFTYIKFDLKKSEDVLLQVFDLSGRLIYMFNDKLNVGSHSLKLEKNVFPQTGTYLYRLVTTDLDFTKKLMVIR